MILRGNVASLVPFDRRHLNATRGWANDWEIAELMDRATPVSDAAHEQWFAALQERNDCVYFAIEANEQTNAAGAHCGNVWLWNIDPRHRKAEVRIVVGHPAVRGRGLGAQALALVARYAFRRLNLARLYAKVLAHNTRAIRAFEKAGFQREGVLRNDRWSGERYADVISLGLLRDAPKRDAPESGAPERSAETPQSAAVLREESASLLPAQHVG